MPRKPETHKDGSLGSLERPIYHEHAAKRWIERIQRPIEDIVPEFRKSIALQRKGDVIVRLSPCGAVFLTTPTWVIVTVLTLAQYRQGFLALRKKINQDELSKSRQRRIKEARRRRKQDRRW